jgi:XTP/dITP diphosphohydrolase
MTVLIVATGNPGKLKELQDLLSDSGWELRLKPETLDVEETGTTFAENAGLKASQVAQATQQWAIADDSGLEVEALGGAPGVYSARYGQTDGDRIARLLHELEDTQQRTARFVCVIAVARPDGTIALQAEGSCSGRILTAPRGAGGFGYDPVFYVPEQDLTFAEMSPEKKRLVSHRGRALAQLLPALQALHPKQS